MELLTTLYTLSSALAKIACIIGLYVLCVAGVRYVYERLRHPS